MACLSTSTSIISQSLGRKSSRKLEAVTQVESIEECVYRLALPGLLSRLSYAAQDGLPRSGNTPGGLGPKTSASNLRGVNPRSDSLVQEYLGLCHTDHN